MCLDERINKQKIQKKTKKKGSKEERKLGRGRGGEEECHKEGKKQVSKKEGRDVTKWKKERKKESFTINLAW